MATQSAEQRVFEACLALDIEERAHFIQQACTGHPELAERVHRLLEAHERAEKSALATSLQPRINSPKRIGPYRLLRVIGEGGMGVVYEAAQLYPVRRNVALKLIRWGMDSRQIVARFEAERQALAVMDHPNIARVLDAGATQEGSPFFVMELVQGEPLTTFCDGRKLSIRQRLELFGCLSRAVQHAHQKGVIHRDLKPSNVLVACQDETPTLKVIDFGIAKAVGSRLGNETLVTQVGTAMGTPAYMSPEQAETVTLDIDTRTDIYSLGVILYELLVGVLPVVPDDVGMPAFLAQLGNREIDPVLPSVRLQSLGERGREIAECRRTELSELLQELRADLDWVVTKAIDKERARRYESADALAAEIRRYLDNEPLLARPPSLSYRCRKLVRRHRPVIAAAAVALVALLVGIVGVVAGLLQAEQSKQEAVRQAVKATEAERDATSRLRHALVAQARALRGSQTPGRRRESLMLLSQAAALRPGPDLRNEGIASITLTDLERVASWPNPNRRGIAIDFDERFEQHAWGFAGGRIEIHREGEDDPGPVLAGFGGDPWPLTFSPDGRLLAVKYQDNGSEDGGCVKIWNAQDGHLEARIPLVPAGSALVFSPDGKDLAMVAADQQLVFFDLRERRVRRRVPLPYASSDLTYRRDGRFVSVSTTVGTIEVRDAEDGRLIRRLEHPGRVYLTDFSGDGKLIAGAYSDGTAVIWSLDEGRPLSTLRGHQAEVVRVRFHPVFPLVFTYSWDETTRLWEISTGKQLLVAPRQALEFSSDGRFLSFIDGDGAGVWQLQYGQLLHTYYGHEGKGPRSLDLSQDGRRIVSGGLDGLLLWDAQREQPIARVPTLDVRDTFFAVDRSEVISCGAEGLIRWKLEERGGALEVAGRQVLVKDPCEHAEMESAAGSIISLHPELDVYVHFAPGRSAPIRLTGFPGMAHPSLTQRDHLVAVGNWRGDRTVVWDGRSGKVVRELLSDEPSVGVLFSADGRWLVTGSTEEYLLWSTETWSRFMRIHRPPRFSHLPGLMAFSDQSDLLAVVIDNRTIAVYDPVRRQLLLELQLPDPQGFSSIRFSGDGSHLGASTTAHQLHVWNIKRILEELHPLGLDYDLAARWPGESSDERSEGRFTSVSQKGIRRHDDRTGGRILEGY